MIGTAQGFTAEERQKYIGASELAACLGLDKYKTPLDLYNQKRGLVPAFEGNKHTERGNYLEAIAADYFTAQTGRQLRRRSEAFVHPEHPFIIGHIDRKFVGEKRLAEIKCPSVASFRQLQRKGLPENYIVQANAYMGLAEYPSLTFIIFCADLWDAAIFDIEFDETIYTASVNAAVRFWNEHVVAENPPRFEADKANIEFEKVGGDTTYREDPKFVEAAQMLREADRIKKDGEELYDLAKVRMLETIEQTEGVYEGGGLRLHYKSQAGRKSFDKKKLAAAHPEITLTDYETVGAPIKSFRPIFIGER